MDIAQVSYYANVVSFGFVLVMWFVFGWNFLLRKRLASTADTKRAPGSWAGLALQGVGFGIVWSARRAPVASPLIEGQFVVNIVLQLAAVILAAASRWLAMSAITELGRQWSLAARLTEDHKLVKTGVYAIVRHPIYTAMLGLMIATGLVLSNWIALAAAIVIFFIGTRIRTHLEEELLREAFGEEFMVWKERVPSLLPFVNI